MSLSLEQLAAAVGSRSRTVVNGYVDPRASSIARIVSDSREVRTGDVFWALEGPRHDGADYLADAYRSGAVGVVTSRDALQPPPNRWAIVVDDPQQALTHAAQWQRQQFNGRVVAVTGSVGKTTARKMIEAVLRQRFTGTASPRNFNNHIGVPLAMLACRPQHDYAVLELGASATGEIRQLANLCLPRVGVITRIADAHLGTFGSRQNIASTKAELLDALPNDGLAILNADDPHLKRVARRSRAPIVWVGRSADAAICGTHVRNAGGRLEFEVDGRSMSVPVWGRHHLISALAAVAVGREFGLTWDEITAGLATFSGVDSRCQVLDVHGATVINDSYNSSPVAAQAALELLRDFDAPGRRIVLCGDMCDLGDESVSLHHTLGQQVVTTAGANVLLACGRYARTIVEGAKSAGMPTQHTHVCHDVTTAAHVVASVLRPQDVLLVKGSRAMALERVVTSLMRPRVHRPRPFGSGTSALAPRLAA
jgi:UDP-N-acetylmuramoyl-tripeptide--D-alanyl-D-alanine ligase